MQRQRVRLTDQALVAVAVARAGARERPETVADLLLGLAIEPEGAAGRQLREQPSGLAALQKRVEAPLPALAPLGVAVDWAAKDADPRPAATGDLLEAALEAGGSELADLLDACGLQLVRRANSAGVPWPDAAGHPLETFGYDPSGTVFTPPAARAVARARAVAGGPAALVALLALEDDSLPLDVEALSGAAAAVDLAAGDLDAAVDAAVAAGMGGRVDALDLLRAALTVGGPDVRALVDAAAP